jgi:hypothetical protein
MFHRIAEAADSLATAEYLGSDDETWWDLNPEGGELSEIVSLIAKVYPVACSTVRTMDIRQCSFLIITHEQVEVTHIKSSPLLEKGLQDPTDKDIELLKT